MSSHQLAPPDAVRVWRGFRASTLPQAKFFEDLSTVFVPATVKMQTKIGLDAYIPTIPAGLDRKPDTAPDETAILYWNSQQTYEDGFKTLAVRTYTLTHAAVYAKGSTADFPTYFEGKLQAEQPCYLIDQPADWMHGDVAHLVAARPDGTPPGEFAAQVAGVMAGVQERAEVAGAVVCVGDDYLVYWELAGSGHGGGVADLEKLVGWKLLASPAATSLPEGLWDPWPGMDIEPGSSFNMQWDRETRK